MKTDQTGRMSRLIRVFAGCKAKIRYEPRCVKTGLWGFPNRSDTNRTVQSQKMARGLKFRIYELEGMYYPCSENKGADQLRGYREADLRL